MKNILVVAGASVIKDMKNIYNYKSIKNEFSKETLEKLLIEDGYTYRELQGLYHYNERLWSKLAKEYGIPKQTKNIARNCNKYHLVEIDDELLVELYEVEKYSLRQLENVFNCNRAVIKKHLKNLNISIRPFNDKAYYKNRNKTKSLLPYVDSSGYIAYSSSREHRLVMEKHLGRVLSSEECVHHIDFDKTNNDISNLFLFYTNEAHLSYHGYIKSHEYITPQDFMDNIYDQILYYKSEEFLYEQYVVLNKSVVQISKEINNYVSRTTLTQLLRKYNIFVDGKHVNQYD